MSNVTLIITKAAAALRASGVRVRVVDVFSVKPFDWRTVLDNVSQTKGNVVVVEDHYAMGRFLVAEWCSSEFFVFFGGFLFGSMRLTDKKTVVTKRLCIMFKKTLYFFLKQ